jgi:hypothetical protein
MSYGIQQENLCITTLFSTGIQTLQIGKLLNKFLVDYINLTPHQQIYFSKQMMKTK